MREKNIDNIQEIAVIGCGLMGHGIAQTFAQKGYSVTIYDTHCSILEKAVSQIRSNLNTFLDAGLETEERVQAVLSNLRITLDLESAVKKAQFVVEAAPEDLALKMSLFAEMDEYAHPDAILASNTSTLPISQIGKKVARKERLIVTHWFNPPHIIPVVEVVRGEATSQEVFEISYHLLKKIGKRPVKILKEIPGFLINRIQTAMFREILSLLEQQVATAEDIDIGVTGSFGLRLAVQGPLQVLDMGGLDLLCKGMQFLYPVIDRSTEVQKILAEKIERGALGLKTGEGFFQYDQGEALALAKPIKERDKRLLFFLKTLSQ